MPSRKGLPTKRKMVSRLSKTGKLSTYSQRYHLNPFKRTSSKDRGSKAAALASNKVSTIVNNFKKKPGINRKASIDAVIKTSNNNAPNGVESTRLLSSKIKSDKDVKKLSTDFLSSSLSQIGPINNTQSGLMANEHSLLINNIPETEISYNTVISTLLNNRLRMDDRAFSHIIGSFSNHKLLESVLQNTSLKSEAYDKEDLLHD